MLPAPSASTLVEQALQQDHSVTAFVRDPARLRAVRPSLRHVVGDVTSRFSLMGEGYRRSETLEYWEGIEAGTRKGIQ